MVGRGVIDPLAALTFEVPIDGQPPVTVQAAELSMPPPPAPPDTLPKSAAATVAGVVVALLAVVFAVVTAAGLKRKTR